jgi:hypothetical protein
MDFEQFNHFFRDFDIFPNILNLLQLKNIFFTLQELIKYQIINNKDPNLENTYRNEVLKKVKINFDYFMDAILLSSIHIKGMDELNDIEKIISIVEKMSNSNGIVKSQKRSGNTL